MYLTILVQALLVAPTLARGNSQYNEVLIFHDDFNHLNMRKWKHELTMGGGGNWEFEMYVNSRRNSYVRDGVLFLKPTLSEEFFGETVVMGGHTDWQQNRVDMWGSTPADMCTGNQFYGCERIPTPDNPLNYLQTARVRTAESFSFMYGRVEIRAQLPRGDWLWPALWMLPLDNVYGPWPASGEIDIMESRGNPPSYISNTGQHMGCDSYGATLHWGPSYNVDGFANTMGTYTLPKGDDFSKDYHVFGVYWTPEELVFYVDEESNVVNKVEFNEENDFWKMGLENEIWKSDKDGDIPFKKQFSNPWLGAHPSAPFNQEFYLIFNLAIGGTAGVGPQGFFPDGLGGKPWVNTQKTALTDFIQAKSEWLPSWTKNGTHGQIGESAALKIDSVHVWGFEGVSTWTYHTNYTGKGIVAPGFQASEMSSGYSNFVILWMLVAFFSGLAAGVWIVLYFVEVRELARRIFPVYPSQGSIAYGSIAHTT